MKGKYYYLISGLPHIRLDESGDCPAFFDFVEEAMELVSAKDSQLLKIIRLPWDNRNLINLLENKDAAFNKSGNYSEAELRREIADPERAPQYMKALIEAHKIDMPVYYNIAWEDQLNCLFYEYIATIDNTFLRGWFSFELNLGNLLSALKCREFNISFERRLGQRIENVCSQAIICHNEVTETIMDSNTPDFSLTPLLPWVEDILSLDKTDLVGFEKSIDLIKWGYIDDMTRFNYFDMEALLAYGIKLQIVERWKTLEAEKGAEHFNELLLGLEGVHQDYKDNLAGAVTGVIR